MSMNGLVSASSTTIRVCRRPQRLDPLPDMVAVGEEQARIPPGPPDLVGSASRSSCRSTSSQAPSRLASPATCGRETRYSSSNIDTPMPITRPGRVSKISTPSIAAIGGGEIGPGGETVDAAQPVGPHPVQPAQRREIDQLDHGGDHHRRQRRFRQLLEQAGEEQQGDQRQHRDHQPTDLGPGSGGAVHRGLGQAAVDHHSGAQPGSEVGRAQPDQLPVRPRSGTRPWPRRSSPRPDPRRIRRSAPRPPARPGRGRPDSPPASGQTEIRQAGIDLADDLHPAVLQAEHHRRRRCPAAPPAAIREPAGTSSCRPAPPPGSARRPAGSATGCRRDAVISPQVCWKKSPSDLRDAEELRHLADQDRQRQPDDETLQHRLGDERGDEPQPQQTGQQTERSR